MKMLAYTLLALQALLHSAAAAPATGLPDALDISVAACGPIPKLDPSTTFEVPISIPPAPQLPTPPNRSVPSSQNSTN